MVKLHILVHTWYILYVVRLWCWWGWRWGGMVLLVTDRTKNACIPYPLSYRTDLALYSSLALISLYSFRSLVSKGFPTGYSKSLYVRLHSENSEPTMFSQTTPDEHPPTRSPCRWSALITPPTLAKFQLVWRRLCDCYSAPLASSRRHPYGCLCATRV